MGSTGRRGHAWTCPDAGIPRLTAARFVSVIEGLAVWPTLLRPGQPDAPHVDAAQIAGLTRSLVARPSGGRDARRRTSR